MHKKIAVIILIQNFYDSSNAHSATRTKRNKPITLLTTFELAPTASGDGTTLVESVDVAGLSCDPNTVLVEIEHPCPSADCFATCTEVATDRTFTGTITNKVGVCVCLPDSVSHGYALRIHHGNT